MELHELKEGIDYVKTKVHTDHWYTIPTEEERKNLLNKAHDKTNHKSREPMVFYVKAKFCHIIDHFTKYIYGTILKDKSAQQVVSVVSELMKKHNVHPKTWFCDNGSEFKNELFRKELVDAFGSQIVFGPPGHPQSQGVVERPNQTIKTA